MDIKIVRPEDKPPEFYGSFWLGRPLNIFNPAQHILKHVVCGNTVKIKKIWNGRKFKLKQEVR